METPRLHCYHGQAPPADVTEGWKRLKVLPEDALPEFWGLLGPALLDPRGTGFAQKAASFGQAHGAKEEDVLAAARACEMLLGRAAALDLGIENFRQDLVALSGGPSHASELILSQYIGIKAELRKRIVVETLSDHGKLLVGLNWRVDQVTASERGVQLNAPVVFLTMIYREGNELDRITLQLTPDAVKDLKSFCDRFQT